MLFEHTIMGETEHSIINNIDTRRLLCDVLMHDSDRMIVSEKFGCIYSNTPINFTTNLEHIINKIYTGMQLSNYMCISSDESTYVGIVTVSGEETDNDVDMILDIPDILYKTLASSKPLRISQLVVFEDNTTLHTKKKLYVLNMSYPILEHPYDKYRIITIVEDKHKAYIDKWHQSKFMIGNQLDDLSLCYILSQPNDS